MKLKYCSIPITKIENKPQISGKLPNKETILKKPSSPEQSSKFEEVLQQKIKDNKKAKPGFWKETEDYSDFQKLLRKRLSKQDKIALFIEAPTENDKEILRLSIIAELDAVSLYERFAETAIDPDLKKVLLDIAKEEKVHVHELQLILDELDVELQETREQAQEEIDKLT